MEGGGEDDGIHLPLWGVVLCCTSITPEIRSQIADIAIEMGADHKLDLTSDVTHMIVGELQTPKYKYVAKEREDVKCLLVDWVYAVREQFLSGGDVAVEALERKYRVPTLWGLTICITGFEDPDQRREIELEIAKYGAEYRGDLRKDCTHLICFTPMGAKYNSAKAWSISTVSIEWLSMSIQRGMALDEECFSPTMLPEERGKGAWKRTPLTRVDSLKRAGSEGQIGRVRKLRRTASARFSTDNVWGDIVSAAPSQGSQGDALSMTERVDAGGFHREPEVVDSFGGINAPRPNPLRRPLPLVNRAAAAITKPMPRGGIFHGKKALIHGFDNRRTKLLEQHLQAQDAETFRDIATFRQQSTSGSSNESFTIVPYTTSPQELTSGPELPQDNLVTELWLEKCLYKKQCILPCKDPIYAPLNHPLSGFEDLVVCSTGFEGVDLMHMTKILTLLGARYAESLSPTVSLLLCKDHSLPGMKIKYAIRWKVPAIDAKWLWDCISLEKFQAWDDYLIHPALQAEKAESELSNRQNGPIDPKKQLLGRAIDKAFGSSKPPDLVVKDSFSAKINGSTDTDSALQERQVVDGVWQASESLPVSEPLRELSSNVSRQPSQSPTKQNHSVEDGFGTQQTREELANALTSILNKAREHRLSHSYSPSRKRRQLLGRARSDLSTRSIGSRADSVDSMNTDGLGTPLEANFRNSPSKAQPPHLKPSPDIGKMASDSLTAELLLSHEEMEEQDRVIAEEEETPVMTQVGYDDAEAGIWRERLSRKMAGQTGNMPTSPEIEREVEQSRKRNILRDEGRQSISTRTRHNLGS